MIFFVLLVVINWFYISFLRQLDAVVIYHIYFQGTLKPFAGNNHIYKNEFIGKTLFSICCCLFKKFPNMLTHKKIQ